MTIDIKGLDKAELLAALVNNATTRGMGFLHDDGKPMTKEEAQRWIAGGRQHDTVPAKWPDGYVDYVKGRPIKCNIAGDYLNPIGYDHDHGQGAAERVVAELRARLVAGAVQ